MNSSTGLPVYMFKARAAWANNNDRLITAFPRVARRVSSQPVGPLTAVGGPFALLPVPLGDLRIGVTELGHYLGGFP